MAKKVRGYWDQVTVPRNFREAAEEIVREKRYGYQNLPEFTRDAIRRLLLDLGYFKNERQ